MYRGSAQSRPLFGPGSPLRAHSAYRRLWLAQTGSWFGDYFNSVALAAATLSLTHSPAAMGLVLLCRSLPGLIVGPLCGPLIDRWPKRTVLWMTDLVRALLALAFIASFSAHSMVAVYAASALLGLGASLFVPAQRAAIRQVIPTDDIVSANATLTATSGFVAVVGAALGGVAAARLGPDPAFALNALSYIWSAAWILSASWPETPPADDGRRSWYGADLRAGARALTGNRVALAVALASVGFALTSGPYFVAPPVLADLVYGMGGIGIGLVYAADGVGFILSSLLLGRLAGEDPVRQRRLYGGSYLVQAVFLCLFCLSTRLWEGMAAILISQVAAGGILTLTGSFLQTRTSPAVQGRVFAFQGSVGAAAAQVSIALSGFAMARYGVGSVAVAVGLVCIASAVVWFALTSDASMAGEASAAAR